MMRDGKKVPSAPSLTECEKQEQAGSSQSVSNVKSSSSRIVELDGLRGIAIALVFIFHVKPTSDSPLNSWALDFVVGPLWCGVDLFFVLSGFLITGILYDEKGSERYFLNFYARRTLRIFPLYYGVLVGLFVVLPLLVQIAGVESLSRILDGAYYTELWNKQWSLWLYLQNFIQANGPHQLPGLGHFWSLAIEEQFYLIWPMLVFFSNGRRLFWICLSICALGIPLRWIMLEGGWDAWAVRHLSFARIDALAMGGLAAILVREFSPSTIARVAKMTFGISLATTLILMCSVPGMHRSSHVVTVAGYSAFAALFTSVILFIATDLAPRWSRKLLSNRVLVFLGTLSYGIYVFHWPLLHACRAIVNRLFGEDVLGSFGTYALETVFVTVSSVLAAVLSWTLFEAPILRLKKRFH